MNHYIYESEEEPCIEPNNNSVNNCSCNDNKEDNCSCRQYCRACTSMCNSAECKIQNISQTQRRIQKTVRVSGSEYTMNKSALTVAEYLIPVAASCQYVGYSCPQGLSDRRIQHTVPLSMNISRNRTRAIPGQTSAPGTGVDVKHGSYARYLARKKGMKSLREQGTNQACGLYINNPTMPIPCKTKGGKIQKFGIIPGCSYNC